MVKVTEDTCKDDFHWRMDECGTPECLESDSEQPCNDLSHKVMIKINNNKRFLKSVGMVWRLRKNEILHYLEKEGETEQDTLTLCTESEASCCKCYTNVRGHMQTDERKDRKTDIRRLFVFHVSHLCE